jgi:hypothetical protein
VMADKEKPFLQGWAMVENPTDEDWAGVKMALVSGRPISFKMDLYNPLFVPRPTVEPELFASLRPPTYAGGFNKQDDGVAKAGQPGERQAGTGGAGGVGGGRGMARPGMAPMAPGAAGPMMGFGAAEKAEAEALRRTADANNADGRFARDFGKDLAGKMNMGAVGNAATAGTLGDFFQYVIDHPVSLARQKSAMLPIVGKDVEGSRVSIYNPAVQAKHPLLGLRFKNTTGVHLNQGPVTVFEGSTYAGDTRVLDVQPGEERLLSYAIDLGTEVDPQTGPGTSRITSVKAVKGIVTTVTKVREEKKYRIINRSQTDRTVMIEHPNRTNQQFKIVDTEKPVEDTAAVYRFQTAVKAGEQKTFPVTEERDVTASVTLSNNADGQIRYFMSLNEASPELKKKLAEALTVKASWDTQVRELQQIVTDLQRLNADQDRIRKNLSQTPKEAEVYTQYLKKLSDQEKEIDTLTTKQKKLMGEEFAARKKFEDYLANISD